MENKWLDSVVEAHRTYFGGQAEVIFDIGTRDGDDAAFLNEKLGPAKVYCIDGNPKAVEVTRNNYPDFEVFETAVSNRIGTTRFLQIHSPDKDVEGGSAIYSGDRGEGTEGVYEDNDLLWVPVTTMENLLYREDLNETLIDVAKVDVETWTMEVISGFGEYVKNVKVFHLETERSHKRFNHFNNVQVAATMRHFGFFLVDVSYEWGNNIQDQVWINLSLIDSDKLPTSPEVDENSSM